MSKKISELTSANNLTGTEVIPIVQSGTTMKATVDLVRPTVATSITSSSTNSEVAGAKAVYDNSLDVYSTTEHRVGTWIDGKPLYRVAIKDLNAQCTTEGTSASKTLLTINNVDEYLLLFSSGVTSSGNFAITLPSYTTSLSLRTRIILDKNVNTNEMSIKAQNSVVGYNDYYVYAIVLYTKTTDTATRSLNATLNTMNTGSLVGMGDRTEINTDFDTEPESVTLKKEETEIKGIEDEGEGSGDINE